jgi:predicted component of type VI protein secretion system
MKLHYSNQDGASREFELGEKSVTIGRSADADIILLDDKVSRHHCGIRGADGALFIKDLKSKNGTFVNGERVESARLFPSDVIKVGSYTFTFDEPSGAGAQTALREISDEMSAGKGYATLLKQIVHDSEAPPASARPPAPAASETPAAPKAPPVNIPGGFAAPPKISMPSTPAAPEAAATQSPAAEAPKAPAAPVLKKPIAPTRPKILIKSPVRPAATAAPSATKDEAPAKATEAAPESKPAMKPPMEAKPAAEAPPAATGPGKTVIRKPVRPPIRLNLNKKL